MKIFLSTLVLLLLISCSDSEMSSEDITDMTNNSITNLEGQFVPDTHPTSGTVILNADSTVLDFENFMTDSGPKLLVYLSATVNSMDYVDLGDLKGVNGNYSYTIPANTDLSKYKYVVIWCVDFSVSFGHAELK